MKRSSGPTGLCRRLCVIVASPAVASPPRLRRVECGDCAECPVAGGVADERDTPMLCRAHDTAALLRRCGAGRCSDAVTVEDRVLRLGWAHPVLGDVVDVRVIPVEVLHPPRTPPARPRSRPQQHIGSRAPPPGQTTAARTPVATSPPPS